MTDQKLIGSEKGFEELLRPYRDLAFSDKLENKYKLLNYSTRTKLNIYLEEMKHGYAFISKHIPNGKLRILEVGAGLGLLSIYLQAQGHEVVALEPAAHSFDFFEATKQEIWADLKHEQYKPKLISKLAEELTVDEDGAFDFIFSINVLEHIADVEQATARMISLLKPEGICVNMCPNYIVPYEPHYSIPLTPGLPQLSRVIFASKIDNYPDTWDTLNFITYFDVINIAKTSGAKVHFEKGVMYEHLERLNTDKEFAQRHKDGLIGPILVFLMKFKVLGFLKFLPVMFSSPMVFTFHAKNSTNDYHENI